MKVLQVVPAFPPAWRAGGPGVAVAALAAGLAARGVEVVVLTTDDGLEGAAPPPRGPPWSEARPAAREAAQALPRTPSDAPAQLEARAPSAASTPAAETEAEAEAEAEASDAVEAASGYALRRFALARPRRLLHAPGFGAALAAAAGAADLVHVHTLWNLPSAAGCRAALRAGRPLVVSPRGMLDPVITARRRWKRWLYERWVARPHLRSAAAIHFTADDERRRARLVEGHAGAFVVPNPIALEPASEADREAFYAVAPAARGREVVLFLGRLAWKKGLGTLGHAFARVLAARPDTHLVIAGPDDEGEGARARAALAEGGALERASFVGLVEGAEKRGAFAAASVFALPSLQENFANAAAEALAAGLPVVLSDRVAIHAEVEAAGAGLTVPAEDPAALAAAILALLAAPERRVAAGEAGRHLAASRWAPLQVAARMEAIYADVLAGARRSPDWVRDTDPA